MWAPESSLIACLLYFLAQLTSPTHAWSWRCVDKQCLRSIDPTDENPATSLEVCRLTCGQYGAIWPQPTGLTSISDKLVSFDPSSVAFDYSAMSHFSQASLDFVISVNHLFVDNLSRLCGGKCSWVPGTSVTVYLSVTSEDLGLGWMTDEGYSIDVSTRDNGVTIYISADTVYGARHALETISQMITYTPGNNQLVIISTAKISDKPVFPHRGLLLDSSRNYLSLSAIMRTIDAMATCKLNVLHWHATDTQSFPLVLPRVPQLARYGAYSAKEVYTSADIDALMKYARLRGVRILMELDMPAHAGNGWQWGSEASLGPLAVCVNRQPWRQYCLQPPCGQLNPANPNLYRVLRDVFRDLIDGLPTGEFFHMGGDEVFFPCWNQSTEVTDWMRSRGMGFTQSDFLDIWGEFQKTVLQVWDEEVGNTKTPILLWTSHLTNEDVIQKYLDKDRFVIEAWTDSSDPLASRLLQMGYRVILATKDAWYLDHGFWGNTKYHNWRRAYDNPMPKVQGVLGGEVAMWGELVDDKNLDSRVWPRAAAAAERLWSNPDTDNTAAEYRLLAHRDRLVRYGVQPEAITPEWCAQNQGGCAGSANTS